MAWNPSPEIAVLRDIARKQGFEQVVMLGVFTTRQGDQMRYRIDSYGATKELCDEAKMWNQRINQLIQDGKII